MSKEDFDFDFEAETEENFIVNQIKELLHKYKNILIFFGSPLVFSAIPIFLGTPLSKILFIILLMLAYLFFRVIPIGVVLTIPVVMMPLFRFSSIKNMSDAYMSLEFLNCMAVFIVSITMTRWHIPRQVALLILFHIGTSPLRLLFGFMTTAWLMSMFVTSHNVVCILLPFANDILEEKVIANNEEMAIQQAAEGQRSIVTPRMRRERERRKERIEKQNQQLKKAIFVSISHACLVGQMSSLNDKSNLLNFSLFKRLLSSEESSANVSVGQLPWLLYILPTSIILLLLLWMWLVFFFFGLREFFRRKVTRRHGMSLEANLRFKVKMLPSLTFPQKSAIVIYVLLIIGFATREQHFFPTKSVGLTRPGRFHEVFISTLLAAIAFTWPVENIFNMKNWSLMPQANTANIKHDSTLMTWEYVVNAFPWKVFLVYGGVELISRCLTDDAKAHTEIAKWLIKRQSFQESDKIMWPDAKVSFLLISCLSEFCGMKNHIVYTIAYTVWSQDRCYMLHPLLFLYPASALEKSKFAFPFQDDNMIFIFSAQYVQISDLIKSGLGSKIITIIVILITFSFYGWYILKKSGIPLLGLCQTQYNRTKI